MYIQKQSVWTPKHLSVNLITMVPVIIVFSLMPYTALMGPLPVLHSHGHTHSQQELERQAAPLFERMDEKGSNRNFLDAFLGNVQPSNDPEAIKPVVIEDVGQSKISDSDKTKSGHRDSLKSKFLEYYQTYRPHHSHGYEDDDYDDDSYDNDYEDDHYDEPKDHYIKASINCREFHWPMATNPADCAAVRQKDYDPDFSGAFNALAHCRWDAGFEREDEKARCLCPQAKNTCNYKKQCYWYRPKNDKHGYEEDEDDENVGECIHNSERFYNILAHLLTKRGKKDFAIKIKYSSAAAKGNLPYGPYGPAIIGYNEDPFSYGYGGHTYGSPEYGGYGYGNPGYGNSGYGNSGYGNSGYGNSGYGNSGSGYGYGNAGYGNAGYGSAGYGNAGYGNPGYGNPGYGNPGYGNSGYGYGYGNSGYGHGSPYDSGYASHGNGYDNYNGIPFGSNGYGNEGYGSENQGYGPHIPNYGFNQINPTYGYGGNINYGVPQQSSYGGYDQYSQQSHQNIAGYTPPIENPPYSSPAGYAPSEVIATNVPYPNEIPQANFADSQVYPADYGANGYLDPAYQISNVPGYQPPPVVTEPIYEPSVAPTQIYNTNLPSFAPATGPLDYVGGGGVAYSQPHPAAGPAPINYESTILNQQQPFPIQY